MAATSRYVFRSVPVVLLASLVGAMVGVQLGGIAFATVPALLAGKPVIDPSEFPDGLPSWLRSEVFWYFFLLPLPLTGFLVFGWPAVAAVLKWRRAWLGPKLIYTLGLLAGIASALMPLLAALVVAGRTPGASEAVTLRGIANAFIGTFLIGGALGVPAAAAFRIVALRKSEA